jgi:hypothetical protein
MGIMEVLLSDKSGSLKKFILDKDNNLVPEFFFSSTQDKMSELLDNVQKGIVEFAKAMVESFGEDIVRFNNSSQFLQSTILNYFKNPSVLDAKILEGITLENSIGHMDSIYIIPDDEKHLSGNIEDHVLQFLHKKCLWKIGTQLIISAKLSKMGHKNLSKQKKERIIANIGSSKVRKMAKLVKNPDLFWSDLKDKKLLLIKPFLRTDRSRRKLYKLVCNPRKYFEDTKIYPLKIIKYFLRK